MINKKINTKPCKHCGKELYGTYLTYGVDKVWSGQVYCTHCGKSQLADKEVIK